MKLLALDVAKHLGWCIFANGIYTAGTHILPTPKKGRKTIPDEHPGLRFDAFSTWLYDMITMYKTTHIAYEITGSQQNGRTNQSLLGLRGVLYGMASRYELPILETYPGTLKLHATGNGHASKEDMRQAWIDKFDEDPGDFDETDARWLAHWGVLQHQVNDPRLRVLSSKRFNAKTEKL